MYPLNAVLSLLSNAALNLLRGECQLWRTKEPLTGRSQRLCARPISILRLNCRLRPNSILQPSSILHPNSILRPISILRPSSILQSNSILRLISRLEKCPNEDVNTIFNTYSSVYTKATIHPACWPWAFGLLILDPMAANQDLLPAVNQGQLPRLAGFGASNRRAH